MMKIKTVKLFCLLLVITFSSCSFFQNKPTTDVNESLDTKEQTETIINEKLKNTDNNSDVEILWLIPDEPTDGFILSYGFSEDKITNDLKLFSDQITVISDPVYKKVYKHILRGFPKNKIIYLQLVAFKNGEFSKPSKIFTLRAN